MLLAQVLAIVREQGIEFVSLREVARRANVSHAAPAHHFRNKGGLLTAAAVQGYDLLADTVRGAIIKEAAATPAAILDAMGRAYVRFALQHPEHFAIMFQTVLVDRQDADYRRATDRAYLPLQEVVKQAAAAGPLPADPSIVVTAAWSLVHGLASLWLSGRLQERTNATDAEAVAALVTRLFVEAVLGRNYETGSNLPEL